MGRGGAVPACSLNISRAWAGMGRCPDARALVFLLFCRGPRAGHQTARLGWDSSFTATSRDSHAPASLMGGWRGDRGTLPWTGCSSGTQGQVLIMAQVSGQAGHWHPGLGAA